MKAGRILRPGEIPAHERGGGARTIPLVTRSMGGTTLLNGITEFAPGASIPLHSHNCEESVIVLEGEAVVEIGDAKHKLARYDTTLVPAGLPHRFINSSATRRMKIFWTYASVEATRTLLATGETRPVDYERNRPGS
jgi:quercetin dioxygenase-like cupin family protein